MDEGSVSLTASGLVESYGPGLSLYTRTKGEPQMISMTGLNLIAESQRRPQWGLAGFSRWGT